MHGQSGGSDNDSDADAVKILAARPESSEILAARPDSSEGHDSGASNLCFDAR